MSTLWSRDFWSAAVERAVRTFAQSLLATLSVAGVGVAANVWEPGVYGWVQTV